MWQKSKTKNGRLLFPNLCSRERIVLSSLMCTYSYRFNSVRGKEAGPQVDNDPYFTGDDGI